MAKERGGAAERARRVLLQKRLARRDARDKEDFRYEGAD